MLNTQDVGKMKEIYFDVSHFTLTIESAPVLLRNKVMQKQRDYFYCFFFYFVNVASYCE